MRNLKRILFLFLTIGLAFSLHAQKEDPSWKLTLPRHDLQFGIGDPALIMNHDHKFSWGVNSTADDWFNNTYNALTIAIPTINFEYRYRFAKWFWFGGAISYNASFSRWEDYDTHDVLARTSNHYLSIMPSVRFSWLNTKYVTMYSGISLGCIIGYKENFNTDYEHNGRSKIFKNILVDGAGQLTAVGIQVGKNWYGFTEIGIGCQGFIKAGFGYKFNKKAKINE